MYNYEINKLPVQNPNICNLTIIIVFILLSIFTLKRKEIYFLEKIITDQLKGFAIILITISHLWFHVSNSKPLIIFGYEAVSLFLILSGFGLNMSFQKNSLDFKSFYSKRVKRVILPYWIASFIILFFDYFIIDRSYSTNNLIMTFLGININEVTKLIDYVRWYITLLLFWYIAFSIIYICCQFKNKLFIIFQISIVIYFLENYVSKFGWYQIFGFPIGCLIAHYFNQIKDIFESHSLKILISSFFLVFFVSLYKVFIQERTFEIFPYIICKFLIEFNSHLFSISMIVLIAYMGKRHIFSNFLSITGSLSYEIFLLHGVFLIKYNPIIHNTSSLYLANEFFIFFFAIFLISLFFQRITNKVNEIFT